MRTARSYGAVLSAFLMCLTPSVSAAGHRLLLLDIGRYPNGRPGSDHHRLLLLDTESGQVAATAVLGINTNLALSPQGEIVAAVSWSRGPAADSGGTRLTFYRTKDLSLLESGRFPDSVPRRKYQLGAAADCALAPEGQTLLLCGSEGTGNIDLITAVLNTVDRKRNPRGSFEPGERAVRIPRCRGVDFVSVANWPRVHVLNQTVTLLEVVDFRTGDILSRLPLGDDPALNGLDPASLERADFKMILRLRHNGAVLPGGGRYAYYIPRGSGFLKKIDLLANPPQVVRKSEKREAGLNFVIAAASEAAGRLFVLEYKSNDRLTHEPSRTVKVFRTTDFTLQRPIELPVTDCQNLQVSREGKYLYALDAEAAKLAVVDAASGREVKVWKTSCTYPLLMIALPD
jgi:hypothetical protein